MNKKLHNVNFELSKTPQRVALYLLLISASIVMLAMESKEDDHDVVHDSLTTSRSAFDVSSDDLSDLAKMQLSYEEEVACETSFDARMHRLIDMAIESGQSVESQIDYYTAAMKRLLDNIVEHPEKSYENDFNHIQGLLDALQLMQDHDKIITAPIVTTPTIKYDSDEEILRKINRINTCVLNYNFKTEYGKSGCYYTGVKTTQGVFNDLTGEIITTYEFGKKVLEEISRYNGEELIRNRYHDDGSFSQTVTMQGRPHQKKFKIPDREFNAIGTLFSGFRNGVAFFYGKLFNGMIKSHDFTNQEFPADSIPMFIIHKYSNGILDKKYKFYKIKTKYETILIMNDGLKSARFRGRIRDDKGEILWYAGGYVNPSKHFARENKIDKEFDYSTIN